MVKILNILLLLLTFFSFINYTNATLWLVNWISLDKSTDKTLDISWESVAWAYWYNVYYSETPIVDGYYDDPISEFIEESNYTISDLDKSTKYYISIKVIDSNVDEWSFSNEVSFSTKWTTSVWNGFWLSTVRIDKLNKIILIFSSWLDDSSNSKRSFRITKKSDPLKTISISSTEIQNSNELLLYLDEELEVLEQYNLTVISIKSDSWENIESWINWLVSFVVPESFKYIKVIPEKNPVCTSLILWNTSWDAPFTTTVSCEWKDVDTFKILCWNGNILTKKSEWINTFIWECNYSVSWTYEVKCYINESIINDKCMQSINIYAPIVIDDKINPKLGKEKYPINVKNIDDNMVQLGNIWGTNIALSSKWWKNIAKNMYSNNIRVVASEQNILPDTWPKNIIILLSSLLFGLFIMIFVRWRRI